jgi:hypothetical protein
MSTPVEKQRPYREDSFESFVTAVSLQSAERWVRGGWVRKRVQRTPPVPSREKPETPAG